jgi:aerobic carbon-monoxide dehydrogenase medium subunit
MASLQFFSPESVEEAIGLLSRFEDSRCLAGGQTLGAMMNSGLLTEGALVSLHRITGLRGVRRRNDGSCEIGAMTTHCVVAASEELRGPHEVVKEAAGVIAHPPVRNMGTIGGSVCQADPSSDLPAALVAAGARFELKGPKASRFVNAEEFFLDFMTCALQPGEMLTQALLPPQPAAVRSGYLKYARAHGDYATVSVAVVLEMAQGQCSQIRIALGSAGPHPIRSLAAETCLIGTSLADADLAAAAELLKSAADPVDDVRGSAEHRRTLIGPLLRRAVRQTLAKQVPSHG